MVTPGRTTSSRTAAAATAQAEPVVERTQVRRRGGVPGRSPRGKQGRVGRDLENSGNIMNGNKMGIQRE